MATGIDDLYELLGEVALEQTAQGTGAAAPVTAPSSPATGTGAPGGRQLPIRKIRQNYGEELAREVFREAFPGESFDRKKGLPWLGNLELDGYSARLLLAFEYQGGQHGERVPFFHSTDAEYRAQLDRDRLKVQRCSDAGVKLIVIPAAVQQDDVRAWIRSELKKDGRAIAPAGPEQLFTEKLAARLERARAPFAKVVSQRWTVDELHTLAKSVGYTLHSWERKTQGSRVRVHLHLTCPQGHTTTRLLDNFRVTAEGKLEKQCTVCFHARLGASKRNIVSGQDPLTGIRALDEYTRRDRISRWECKRGHLIIARHHVLKTSKFPCTQCWIVDFEAANAVRCETKWDPSFKPATVLCWTCSCGGEFRASKISIFRKKNLCPHCKKVAAEIPTAP